MNTHLPIVWTLAGADPSSGAGAQSDLLTFADLGVYGCTILTALTAQSAQHIRLVDHTSANTLQAQIDSLIKDFYPQAIKLGMIGNKENADIIAQFLQKIKIPVVVDPIIFASAGMQLTTDDAVTILKEKILPQTTLLTPNKHEIEALLNISIKNSQDIVQAAKKLLQLGVKAVFIKGGHFKGECASDYFSDGEENFWLHSPRRAQANFHGTGCLLSAAITAALALGHELKEAVIIGKMYLNQAMREKLSLTQDVTLLSHQGWPHHQDDLPWLTTTLDDALREPFIDCGPQSLGFYPIVESAQWVKDLCDWGVKTIQLRIKETTAENREQEIIRSIAIARQYQVRLFINDYWQLAIKHGAYGVHLGQEDLATADPHAIQQAHLRLGISTHSFYEVARAHFYQPSYMAFGPIYETTSKPMSFSPRGLQALTQWRKLLRYPLVAIGGIDLQRLPDVLATGVENVAVISAVTKAKEPAHTVKNFLAALSRTHSQ